MNLNNQWMRDPAMRMTHNRALAAVSLTLIAGSLAACDSGKEHAPGPPVTSLSPSSSPTGSQKQDVAVLGPALDQLVYGAAEVSPDKGRCLVTALRAGEVTPQTEQVIVDADVDDWGLASEAVRSEVGDEQAEALLAPGLRSGLDKCVNAQFGTDGEAEATKVEPAARKVATGEPNLKAKYEFSKDATIYSSDELVPGLISMFTSFNSATKPVIEESAQCMAAVIMNAEFSEEALLFIAGGAPITHGSISEHLPTDEDKALWNSGQFQTSLSDCTTEKAQKKSAEDEEDPP